MSWQTDKEMAAEFAGFIAGLGFTVYMAERGTYGFITDKAETRVLSFEFGCPPRLGGNYGPPSTESGTGWSLAKCPSDLKTAEDVRAALYSVPDYNVGKGWRYFTTAKQHLESYAASSKYRLVSPAGAEEPHDPRCPAVDGFGCRCAQ
jgi:hypothetical protein